MAVVSSWWQLYSTPPQNYIGTTLFLSYIAAALILTTLISTDLWSAYSRSRTAVTSRARSNLRICVVFAVLSFAILSRSMILVLVDSFENWHAVSKSFLGKPRLSLRTWVNSRSYVDDLSRNPSLLWDWMIQSTLFDTFARDLLQQPTSRVWTVIALTTAWVNSCEMGSKGHTDGVPKLWMYFAVAQILPPSFAYFLFQIALLVYRKPSALGSHAAQGKSKNKETTSSRGNWVGQAVWLTQILVNVYLCGFAAEQNSFTSVIAAIRLLLISAFTAPFSSAAIRDILPTTRSLRLVQVTFIWFLVLAPRIWVPPQLRDFSLFAVNEPAPVVALAHDWLIGTLGMIVLEVVNVPGA